MRLLLLLTLGTSGCALFTLGATKRSHPTVDGVIQVKLVDEAVRVKRDIYGIPHIEAQSESDMWYGLGFVHAQDRLFQADLSRHLAHGRISEWLGEPAVDLDLFLQSMRLRELGQQTVDNASPEAR